MQKIFILADNYPLLALGKIPYLPIGTLIKTYLKNVLTLESFTSKK